MERDGLSIEQLAEQAGVSVRTVRYYISQGLLPGPGARGKYASYDADHLARLRLIRKLVEQHVPLAEQRERLQQLSTVDLRRLLQEEEQHSRVMEQAPSPREYVSRLLAHARATAEDRPAPPMAPPTSQPSAPPAPLAAPPVKPPTSQPEPPPAVPLMSSPGAAPPVKPPTSPPGPPPAEPLMSPSGAAPPVTPPTSQPEPPAAEPLMSPSGAAPPVKPSIKPPEPPPAEPLMNSPGAAPPVKPPTSLPGPPPAVPLTSPSRPAPSAEAAKPVAPTPRRALALSEAAPPPDVSISPPPPPTGAAPEQVHRWTLAPGVELLVRADAAMRHATLIAELLKIAAAYPPRRDPTP
jgi:DNA-binding transcriptional MerR regulator